MNVQLLGGQTGTSKVVPPGQSIGTSSYKVNYILAYNTAIPIEDGDNLVEGTGLKILL